MCDWKVPRNSHAEWPIPLDLYRRLTAYNEHIRGQLLAALTSNRACSFPARGFPTFFIPRHTLISRPLLLELSTVPNASTHPQGERAFTDPSVFDFVTFHQVGTHALFHMNLDLFHDSI